MISISETLYLKLKRLLRSPGQRRKEEEEARKNFKPFLYCVTELSVPSPIFAAALTRSFLYKKVGLPDNFNELSPQQKEKIIQQTIKKHLKFVREKFNGRERLPGFGYIVAYTLQPTYDAKKKDLIVYTCNGEVMENPPREYKKIRLGVARVEGRGSSLRGLVR